MTELKCYGNINVPVSVSVNNEVINYLVNNRPVIYIDTCFLVHMDEYKTLQLLNTFFSFGCRIVVGSSVMYELDKMVKHNMELRNRAGNMLQNIWNYQQMNMIFMQADGTPNFADPNFIFYVGGSLYQNIMIVTQDKKLMESLFRTKQCMKKAVENISSSYSTRNCMIATIFNDVVTAVCCQ